MVEVAAEDYYGSGYQDMQTRVPDISPARKFLGWEPEVGLRESLRRTAAACIAQKNGFAQVGAVR